MSDQMYHLFASKGCGSAIVEALLVLAELPHEIESFDYDTLGPERAPFRDRNPLGRVPTLVLPDQTVMTESAAMTLHIAERASTAGLVPAPGDPRRARFLDRLIHLVSAIYPTFNYGDDPSRWVSGDDSGAELRRRTDQHRNWLWQAMESDLPPGSWMLGDMFSALDIYVAVMSQWRPGRQWFAEYCPRLHALATAVDRKPRMAPVMTRNFE
jgi:GST-like protein